jgi:hypothetical protein
MRLSVTKACFRYINTLIGPTIQATTIQTTDWDETFTSKFRRSQSLFTLPPVREIRRMIFGNDSP